MKKFWLALVTALGLIVLGGVAMASIPGPDGTIHACYNDSNGNLRVVDSEASCPSGWSPLDWNQVGPPGISGYEIINGSPISLSAGQPVTQVTAQAFCSSGKQILGGGFRISAHHSDEMDVIENRPHSSSPGWFVGVQHRPNGGNLNANQTIQAYAICAFIEGTS